MKRSELHLGGPATPVDPARRRQHARPGRRGQTLNGLGRIDIVIHEQKRRAGTRKPYQAGLGRLLLVGLMGEVAVKAARKFGETRDQQRAVLRRCPPDAGIIVSVAMGILGRERGLAEAAEAMDRHLAGHSGHSPSVAHGSRRGIRHAP